MWSQSPVPTPRKFWCTLLTIGLMTPVYGQVLGLWVCPEYQANEPECTERRARIQKANAGWPGAEGPWAAGTALLPPLVGLGDRVSGPLSDGSLALNKQFCSVASWLPDAFVFLPFFILVCDLSLFPWLYLFIFICTPCDGGYRTLVELASHPMDGSWGGGQG